MSLHIRTISIDCTDHFRLAQFWSQMTGWQEDPEDPNLPGDPVSRLVTDHGVSVVFVPVPEPKSVKNRVHLDLVPQDRTRDDEVQRLLGIGATLVADHRRPDGTGWVVMADPEGNEFCIERSVAERREAERSS